VIISASRRTDIPAFYSEWFYNRIKEGFVLVRNPMNMHQVSKIDLNRDAVDCIVFWTKNPEKMYPNLHLLQDYQYYFHFTINPYDFEIEQSVSRKASIIHIFKRLSDRIGSNRVIWRYDPILLNQKMDVPYHIKYFDILAAKLHGYTHKCIISFVDFYRKAEKNLNHLGVCRIDDQQKRDLAGTLVQIAKSYHLKIEACAEDLDLCAYGLEQAKCVDPILIEELLGEKIWAPKDRNQRKSCGCLASVDIGAYNTCVHGCLYCYANYSQEAVQRNIKNYDENSPLLCSKLSKEDKVMVKEAKSCVQRQKSLF